MGQLADTFVSEFKTHTAMEKRNNTPKTQVYNLVILDKSGSMESIRKEAIDGYNETLGAIRAAQLKHIDTQDHFVSLAATLPGYQRVTAGIGVTALPMA